MTKIDDLIKNIPAGKYAGSSLQTGVMYHDLPYVGLTSFISHRGHTQARVDQIKEQVDLQDKIVLDLGCSVGGIALGCVLSGAKQVYGVDYDMESIAVANQAAEELNLINQAFFKTAVIDLEWVKSLPQFDVVIWLSQWMWLVKQLGMEQAKEILFEVSKKCQVMVFESAAADGMAAIASTTQEDIKFFLEENTAFAQIITLPPLPGWMGRNVYICQNPQFEFKQPTSVITRITKDAIKKQYLSFLQYLEREVYFLTKLAKYDFVPRLLDRGTDYLVKSYCGRTLSTLYPQGSRDQISYLKPQFDKILAILQTEGIQHRDLHGDNILLLGQKVYLIDWSWAKDQDYKITTERVPTEALGQGLYELAGQTDQGLIELICQGIFNIDDYQQKRGLK